MEYKGNLDEYIDGLVDEVNNPSKRPNRTKRFTDDDIMNLTIALNTLDPIEAVNSL
jgi:hypothetical protein